MTHRAIVALGLLLISNFSFGFSCEPGMKLSEALVNLDCSYKYNTHTPSSDEQLEYVYTARPEDHRLVGFAEPSKELLKKFDGDPKKEKAIICEVLCECKFTANRGYDEKVCGAGSELSKLFKKFCQPGSIKQGVKIEGLVSKETTLEQANESHSCQMLALNERTPVWKRCEALCREGTNKTEKVKAQCCVSGGDGASDSREARGPASHSNKSH